MSRKEEKGDTTSGRKLLPRIRRALFQNESDEDDEFEQAGPAPRHGSCRKHLRRPHRQTSVTIHEAVVDAGYMAKGIAAPVSEEPVHSRDNSNSLYEKIRGKTRPSRQPLTSTPKASLERTESEEQWDEPEIQTTAFSPPQRQAGPVVSITSPASHQQLEPPEEEEPHYANLRLKSRPVPVNPDLIHQRQTLGKGVTELSELYSDNRALKAQLRELTLQGSDQIQSLAEEKEGLKKRVALLNELTYKLNVELGIYRQHLAEKGSIEDVDNLLRIICQELSSRQKGTPRWLLDLPATLAVLQSYDEKLKAQTSSTFSGKDKDWKSIQREAASVLQTNERLSRRIEDLEEESRKVHEGHLSKVLQLSAKLEKAELAKQQLELEVGGLQAQYRVVREQYFNVRLENEHSLPLKEHEAAVQQCYKLFEEAKKKYEKDLKDKDKRYETLSKEFASLKHKLHSKEKESGSAIDHLESAKKSLRECHQKLAYLETKSLNLEEEKRVMRKKLEELIASCETTSGVKLQLEGLVGELRTQNASLLIDCKRYPKKVNQLKNKLKVHVAEKDKKIGQLTREMESMEREMKQQKAEFTSELEKLQALLRDKESLIKVLARDQRPGVAEAAVRRESFADSLLLPARQVSSNGATFSPLKD